MIIVEPHSTQRIVQLSHHTLQTWIVVFGRWHPYSYTYLLELQNKWVYKLLPSTTISFSIELCSPDFCVLTCRATYTPVNRPTSIPHHTLQTWIVVFGRWHPYSYTYLLELQVGPNFFQDQHQLLSLSSLHFVDWLCFQLSTIYYNLLYYLVNPPTIPHYTPPPNMDSSIWMVPSLFLYIFIRTTSGSKLLPAKHQLLPLIPLGCGFLLLFKSNGFNDVKSCW
jgi:hypothetical protein